MCRHEPHRLDRLVHLSRDLRRRRLEGAPALPQRHAAERAVGAVQLRQVHLLRSETTTDVRCGRLQRRLSTARTGALCKQQQQQQQPFNGPSSRITQTSRYQKGKTNLDFTEARDSE